MKQPFRSAVLTAAALTLVLATAGWAQAPLTTKVEYEMDVPSTLQMGEYLLPKGQYVLVESDHEGSGLFTLYKAEAGADRTAVAQLHVNKHPVSNVDPADETKVILNIEDGQDGARLLKSFTIAGQTTYNIVRVVVEDDETLKRADTQ